MASFSSFVAAAVPKDWPYKKIFDIKLLRLIESGTLDSIRGHWEEDLPNCKAVNDDKASLALGPGLKIQCSSTSLTCILMYFQKN